ncbi:MAG TPA: hypothetical protein VKV73_06755 [Chloroflexota bacterium]|nr:hypothetical protein [Chloroflexota bacterium]
MDEIADALYALRPDAFAGARDEHIREARANGQQPLARALAQLRRPTQSAWLINLLWRNQRDRLTQLLELGEDLSRAQAQASGPDLLRLTARRRELEAALVRAARSLGEAAEVTVTASMEREVQETLAAALARADVADEIRTGRLVKPAAYAGFGTEVPPLAAPVVEDKQRAAPATARAPKEEDLEARAAERTRRQRAEAEQHIADARDALEVAAEAVADRTRAAEAAEQHRQAVHAQVDQLQDQLRELQAQLRDLRMEVAAAEQAALSAAARRDQADKAHAAARRALAQAEAAI